VFLEKEVSHVIEMKGLKSVLAIALDEEDTLYAIKKDSSTIWSYKIVDSNILESGERTISQSNNIYYYNRISQDGSGYLTLPCLAKNSSSPRGTIRADLL